MKLPTIPGFDQEALYKYAKNAGWLMVARVGSLAIKMVVGIAITNYLGKDQNGILNYPMAFATFFIAAAALGLDGFVTRELLRQPEKSKEYLGTAFVLKLIGGIVVLPVIYFAYVGIENIKPLDTPVLYILIVGATAIFQSFNIIDSYFQSRVQGKYIMKVQVAANLLSAAFKLFLIFTNRTLPWFVTAILIDAVLIATGYLYMYLKNGESVFNWRFDLKLARYLLSHSWPLAFSAILVSIYMTIDKVMIDWYLDPGELGIYSSVVGLSEAWYFIPVAIVTSVFPAIMNARRDDLQRYQKRLQNMYDLMVWISLSVAAVISLSASFIFDIFKPEFASGAPVLSVHVWAGVFVFLGSASSQFLIAEGYTKLAMTRTAMGALVNVLLNIIWIPKYGIMGAAYATLIAYCTATFFILFFTKTRYQGVMMLKSLFLITALQKIFKR